MPRDLIAGVLAFALAASAPILAAADGQFVSTLPADMRIVMMPPDIRYYLMTAGGNPELHEAWTANAEAAFSEAIADISGMRGIRIDVLDRDELDDEVLQFQGLHAALGKALIRHSVLEAKLPSKGDNAVSDWTLGPGVNVIREATGADYAVFVHYRENQASGSRIAFAILAAAASVVIPTSSEHGFATLVDLSTGDVEWFGVLEDDGLEIREAAGANLIAGRLLRSLPLASTSLADAGDAE